MIESVRRSIRSMLTVAAVSFTLVGCSPGNLVPPASPDAWATAPTGASPRLVADSTPTTARSVAIGQDPGPVHGLVVSGTGQVSARPDLAIVSAGVETRAPSALEAQNQNNQTMQKVIDAIKALGVQAPAIQTTGVSLYPMIGEDQVVTGYVAANHVAVRVDAIDQAGPVLDAAVKAGANLASSVQFTLKDQSALRNKALAAAISKAKSKANVMAEALGVEISGIQSVTEMSVSGPMLLGEKPAGAGVGAVAAPIEPGVVSVMAQVTIVFEF